jgi:hypothetical protein
MPELGRTDLCGGREVTRVPTAIIAGFTPLVIGIRGATDWLRVMMFVSAPSETIGRVSTAATFNARLIAVFDAALAAVAGLLIWRSLSWPLVGDATIFHFIAGQMQMGAVPYRDIVDMNMPLVYDIHAAVVAIGGMGDHAWRAFDLAATAIMSAFILALVRPAGWAAGILAVLIMLVTHLLLGPFSTGQRDFLLSIFAVAGALFSAQAAEDQRRRWIHLLLAGAFAMTAALIKPTAALLLILPVVAIGWLRLRELAWIAAGVAATALPVFAVLAAQGGLGAFVTMIRELLPLYAVLETHPILEVLSAVGWMIATGGLVIAAALGIAGPKPPRVRVMIGLTAFGLIHLLAQGKGWFYHIYPLAVGVTCWGAWSLAFLSRWQVFACLGVTALTLCWLVPTVLEQTENNPAVAAAAAMQSDLEKYLPRGARVQMLDSEYGAFRAMARAGMRQATPHIQWFSLLVGTPSVRRDFLAALKADPPAGILLTNSQWPKESGFEATDQWPGFVTLLASLYDLKLTGHADYIEWRLYLRRTPASAPHPG